MGMDFTAFMAHRLDASEIFKFSEELNAAVHLFPNIHRFIDKLSNSTNAPSPMWTITPDYIGGTTYLQGPVGISLYFSEKVCHFSHYIRWGSFLLDTEGIQSFLRGVSYDLTTFFKAEYAIYVPDSGAKESIIMDFIWDDENRDMEFIRSWLAAHCGPPKKRIQEIYADREYGWESEGYYIDDFEDYKI